MKVPFPKSIALSTFFPKSIDGFGKIALRENKASHFASLFPERLPQNFLNFFRERNGQKRVLDIVLSIPPGQLLLEREVVRSAGISIAQVSPQGGK